MSLGLIGRKCGMTRIFTPEGDSIPVSVIEVQPNRISQVKSVDVDGYTAIQVVAGSKINAKVSKPLAGHLAKAGISAGNLQREFRVDAAKVAEAAAGQALTVALFENTKHVDVRGVSRGKGFAGCIKRHNFSMGDATHGNSLSHRAPGSIGQRQSPGRVFPGKKMSGQMGNVNCVVQSLELVRIDSARNLLLVRGAIPGAPGGWVEVTPSVKRKGE